jgi:tRNA(His) guanylyltransferase
MTQDIGSRMKAYEQNRRLEDGAVIIRVDGKSFHTWTEQVIASKPYDELVSITMVDAMHETASHMQGFKLAYAQSDEVTFLLTNTGEHEQLWFGGKLDKIVSVTASMFTFYFNKMWSSRAWPNRLVIPAFFDTRAFNIPLEDAANCFYWRELDWRRNSIVMLGRSRFSHKEMYRKSANDVKQMLLDIGVSWDAQYPWNKFGTFYNAEGESVNKFLNYNEINELAGISVTEQN